MLGNILGGIVSGLFGMEGQNQAQNAATQAQLGQIAHDNAMAASNAALSREMADRNANLAREFLDRNQAFARETASANAALQREFAQMGIKWRVDDAEAAGIHPLYALGTGVTPFSPSATITTDAPSSSGIGGSSSGGSYTGGSSDWLNNMGQGLANAVIRTMDVDERAKRQAELEVLKAQATKDLAIAQYYGSESVRNSDAMASSAAIPISWPEIGWKSTNVIDRQYLDDTVKAKPAEIVSRRSLEPSVTAGITPGFMEVQTSAGRFKIPYSQDISESLENIWNPIVLAPTIYENVADKPWFKDAADAVFGGIHGAKDWLGARYRDLMRGQFPDRRRGRNLK